MESTVKKVMLNRRLKTGVLLGVGIEAWIGSTASQQVVGWDLWR